VRVWLTEDAYEELGGDDPEDARVAQLRDDLEGHIRRRVEALRKALQDQFPNVTVEVG
jgi:hypothetical protein